MKKTCYLFFSALVIVMLIACSNTAEKVGNADEKVNLTISAATSLTDALQEIKTIYEKDNSVQLTFNLGGSGSLAQQIQRGAPVDIFISANENWMDTLIQNDLIIEQSLATITGNRLVLIAQNDSKLHFPSVNQIIPEEVDQIAIGNPESVPAGKYTQEVLQTVNLWDDLENKLILGKDVRQVLTYVETGNVDIGFVYESDALSSDQISILATVPENSHDKITYPGAILASSKHEQEAQDFLTFLTSEQAQQVFEKYGFRQ
ncbi:molybdate ABC transporter substrate-binding protein [Sporosarcina ureilytica]|uniref:Molybdate ABC transporter substrate-binding protein n=1 Tax=Sporosarcina ureilytica TaxID=298596 RepID=A0A1D8JHL1_9BACL|nr:molybdate ABC transporter substrate-binding protein [Sporosarcina ureilytica]AOV08178.1 molybdate ABC transporter substrate-binding protein [Sporosarcina ureilytica]